MAPVSDVATSILTTLCCLWLCREATRPNDVIVVENRTVLPRHVRRRRYRQRRGYYDYGNADVIFVNESVGEKQDVLPLVALKQSVMER